MECIQRVSIKQTHIFVIPQQCQNIAKTVDCPRNQYRELANDKANEICHEKVLIVLKLREVLC